MKKAKKIINLDLMNKLSKRVYEISSEISLLQEEMEDMLTAIDVNILEFKKGMISQQFFKSNERKLKRRTVALIKRINRLVKNAIGLTEKIAREIKSQRIEKK